jgi:hypothetical protein
MSENSIFYGKIKDVTFFIFWRIRQNVNRDFNGYIFHGAISLTFPALVSLAAFFGKPWEQGSS